MAERIHFVGTPDDNSYVNYLKGCVGDAKVSATFTEPTTITEVEMVCRAKHATAVVSTSPLLLQKLLKEKTAPKISNYAGSLIKHNGIEYMFIDPLKQLATVPYGKFLTTRYISKVAKPQNWRKLPTFNWQVITPENVSYAMSTMQFAKFIAVDIETTQQNLAITCIGYTAVYMDAESNTITCQSWVLPMTSEWALAWMRKFNWELKAPKALQNGKYDIAYLARYNAVLYNYLWDTAAMMHCWYSELPKSLDALASFFIRESFYWKDLADTNDIYEYYRYNALDTYNTAMIVMIWMLEAPEWAKKNYELEFPLVFPTHLAEMTGVQRDMTRLVTARNEYQAKIDKNQKRLEALTVPNFNPNSPVQVKQLLVALGCSDLKSTDEKNLAKAALRHPINSLILNLILEIRGDRKLVSTYLSEGKELNGTILYSLSPWGTDTGRLASKEHHFWCGLQIQNIPRGYSVKQTLRAYAGLRIGECDLEQAESRDTAYISGETALIRAVESTRDFHSTNASAFFGVDYDKIYDDEKKKTKDKPLRDLAKRVNHGANYNMGANVLVDTMGEDKIREAARILKLPKYWDLKQIAEFLLNTFHKTYPKIRGSYYPWVISQVLKTRLLVGATGWTRYCFGNPRDNKSDLNALVAHNPQSLNAMKLNKAFMKVFYEVALKYPEDFRLCAQIHDSILFQFTEGKEWLAEEVRKRMEIQLTIKSTTGETYTYTVPAALKLGADGKGSLYWSETE